MSYGKTHENLREQGPVDPQFGKDLRSEFHFHNTLSLNPKIGRVIKNLVDPLPLDSLIHGSGKIASRRAPNAA